KAPYERLRYAASQPITSTRRHEMHALGKFIAVAALTATCGTAVGADAYPSKHITLVNPYAAGGPADTLGRALARELETQLGQPVVVENKGGGGASIGSQIVARAQPDGYTLLLGTAAAHIVTPLMQRTQYDGVKDFRFIGIVGNQPNMLVVHPKLQVKSDRKSTRLNSSHVKISYAVFCLK